MTLECRIKGIEWKWIASIDENKWDSNKNGKNSIEIIMMRNGSGKTTTLELLQHLFAGIPLNKSSTPVQIDRSRYRGLSSYDNGELEESEVVQRELAITIEINQENWMLMYKFDDDEDSAEIHTRSPDGEYSTEYNMPSSFSNVFKNNLPLCQAIFIDATDEKRTHTLMDRETLDDMIQRLSNIKILNIVREERIPRLIEQIRKEAKNTATAKQKEDSEQQLKVVNTRIEKLEDLLKEEKNKLETKEADLKINEEIIRNLRSQSKNAEKYKSKESELKVAEDQRRNAAKDLLEALFVPGNLPNGIFNPIKNYYAELAKERIPESIAEEYLDAILERGKCICGSVIHKGEELEKCILNERRRSMGMPILSDVYSMKAAIRSANKLSDLDLLKKRIKGLNTRVDEISTDLDNLGGKETGNVLEKMREAAGNAKGFERDIVQLKKNIVMRSETDMPIIRQNRKKWVGKSMKSDSTPSVKRGAIKDDCNNIYWAKRIKKVIEDKLSAIAGIEDTQNAANCLSDLLEHIEQKVTTRLQQTLLDETKENLKKFNLQGGLDVKNFTNGITLEYTAFNVKREQNTASTGENLAILMGFSESLGSIMDVQIPLVIDNPVKGSDLGKVAGTCTAIRETSRERNIILFIYDAEREPLEDNLAVKYNYSTLYREHEWYENPIHEEDAKKLGKIGRTKISYDKNMYFNYTSASPKKEGE